MMLSDTHYTMLAGGSGISDENIQARGYKTVIADSDLKALGFAPAQCRAPGLLLPLWTPDGSNGHYIYRPDNPRVYENKRSGRLPDGTYPQRVIKYEMPKGEGVRLDCPPTCRPALADPAVPLFITEGQKKADALASRGACAVALLGVWNFKGRNTLGGTTLLADFDYIALNNRAVYLVFDSDVTTKSGVRAALERLTEHLKRKGAVVHMIYLPQPDNGKTGVDDWFVATGGGVAELTALAEGPRPQPKAAPPSVTLLDTAPNRMSRPLALIGGRAYAATWVWVQAVETEKLDRRGEVVRLDPPRINVEERLMLLRDDGVVFGDGGDRPLAESGLLPVLPEKVPPGLRLSTAALQAYRGGYRPDPADVFRRVCACVDRFIDFDHSLADQPTMVEMTACYIMATWFLDAFTVAGFLWPNGDRGSGKTQLLAIIAELAYLGQLVLAGGSFAALRDLADYGATLAFDDAENLSDPRKTDPDKRTLLLAGNRRGNSVPMKEKVENGWQLRYVNTFSFRLFSATQLPDPILASRTIVVPLIRTPDRYRANADPQDVALWPHERRKLVDDLWLLALAHLPELGRWEATVNAESELTGRNLEPWRALLAVAGWLSRDTKYERRDTSEEPAELVSRISTLVSRMMALSVAYQQERPNVEAADMTALVIRALGFLLGKMIRDGGDNGDIAVDGDVYRRPHFIPTQIVTAVTQKLMEINEIDINPDYVTSRRIGHTLKKMRLVKSRQGHTGKNGWLVSLGELGRWAAGYGLELNQITELNIIPSIQNVTISRNITNITPSQSTVFGGSL